MQQKIRNVGLFLYPQMAPLDAIGPHDVFSMAGPGLFQITTFSAEKGVVRAFPSLGLAADHDFKSDAPIDILVIPGGNPAKILELREDAETIAWLKARAASAEIVLSVCNGAGILAATGLLDGLAVTTHWAFIEELRKLAPATVVVDDMRYVDTGKIVSAAGVTSGLDGALHIVNRLHGPDTATTTARILQYAWANREHYAPQGVKPWGGPLPA